MSNCTKCEIRAGLVGAFDKNGKFHLENNIHSLNSTDGKNLFGEFPEMKTIKLIEQKCQSCHPNFEGARSRLIQIKNGQLQFAM